MLCVMMLCCTCAQYQTVQRSGRLAASCTSLPCDGVFLEETCAERSLHYKTNLDTTTLLKEEPPPVPPAPLALIRPVQRKSPSTANRSTLGRPASAGPILDSTPSDKKYVRKPPAPPPPTTPVSDILKSTPVVEQLENYEANNHDNVASRFGPPQDEPPPPPYRERMSGGATSSDSYYSRDSTEVSTSDGYIRRDSTEVSTSISRDSTEVSTSDIYCSRDKY